MEYTEKELIEGIKAQIRASDNKAIHALMTVYSNQTESEQDIGMTREFNGIGFNGRDAEILSDYAEKYNKYGSLTVRQMAIVKKLMPKYARQLFTMSNSKGNFEKVKVLNPETNRMVTKYRIIRK